MSEVQKAWNAPGHGRDDCARRQLGRGPAEPLSLILPDELFERIAERAAAIAADMLGRTAPASPYLTVSEAADYLRSKPQRVYDLLSAGQLSRYKDGRRVLVSRAELDNYLAAGGSNRVAPALPRDAPTRIVRRLAA
jgi:excisionase family DNA binding protein